MLGLGNPGPEYAHTRHNIGFQVVESLAHRMGISLDGRRWASHYGEGLCAGRPTALALPQTFMNHSGQALDLLFEDFPEFDPSRSLIVVYDDLDLPCGQMRLRGSGGAGGQKGMASLIQSAASESIPRLRFGIGRPPEGQGVTEFVLSRFSSDELALLPPCIEKATQALEHFVEFGIDSAMNQFN